VDNSVIFGYRGRAFIVIISIISAVTLRDVTDSLSDLSTFTVDKFSTLSTCYLLRLFDVIHLDDLSTIAVDKFSTYAHSKRINSHLSTISVDKFSTLSTYIAVRHVFIHNRGG